METGNINIYGKLVAQTGEGKVADTDQIFDKALGKFQSVINGERDNYYTKEEIDNMVEAIKQFNIQIVNTLPEASESTMFIIYLIPSSNPKTTNSKDEYITVKSGNAYSWEQVGSTEIDLSGYSTTEEMNAAILSGLNNLSFLTGEKVANLGIDEEPTAGSQNLVKSGGVEGELPTFKMVGKGTTNVYSSKYHNIIGGHWYRIYIANPNIDVTDTGENYKFGIREEIEGAMSLIFRTGSVPLKPFYDVQISDNATGIDFYMKAVSGEKQMLIVQDITAKKDGIFEYYPSNVHYGYLREDGKFNGSADYNYAIIPIKEGGQFIIENYSDANDNVRYAFVTSDAFVSGGMIPLADGCNVEIVNHQSFVTTQPAPADAKFLLVNYGGYKARIYHPSRYWDDLKKIESAFEEENKKISSLEECSGKIIAYYNKGSMTINSATAKVTTAYSTYVLHWYKCTKGEQFYFNSKEGFGNFNPIVAFSATRPDIADTDVQILGSVSYTHILHIDAPDDGYICFSNRASSSGPYNNIVVSKLQNTKEVSLMLQSYEQFEIGGIYDLGSNAVIDCDPDSQDYGNVIRGFNSNNVHATDYIDIAECNYVGIPFYYGSYKALYQNTHYAGSVFYDENKTPIAVATPISFCTAYAVGTLSVALAKVPEGTKYIRMTLSAYRPWYICYGKKPSSIIDSDTIKNIIKEDTKTITARTIFELNPDTEMLQKIYPLRKKTNNGSSGESTIVPLVLAHISDAHGGTTQYQRYIEFATHWKDKGYIDELIDTGDIVSGTYGDGVSWRNELDGVSSIITVVGNHDTRATEEERSSEGLSGFSLWNYHSHVSPNAEKRNDAYNLLMVGNDNEHPYIDNWGVIQPANAAENGLCYYYKDYTSKGIRMICLDVMGYDSSQHTWLQELLSDAILNNLHVVILTHFTGTSMQPLACNYTSLRTTGAFSGNYSVYLEQTDPDALAEAVDAFQQAGGIFIGYVIGHYHRDMVNIVEGYPKQLVFAVSSGGRTPIRDFTKIVGCKSYDDFQLLSINTYDKTVRLVKVGADVDYYMRKKSTLCVGYTLVKDDGTEPSGSEVATKVKGIIGEGQ